MKACSFYNHALPFYACVKKCVHRGGFALTGLHDILFGNANLLNLPPTLNIPFTIIGSSIRTFYNVIICSCNVSPLIKQTIDFSILIKSSTVMLCVLSCIYLHVSILDFFQHGGKHGWSGSQLSISVLFFGLALFVCWLMNTVSSACNIWNIC